MSARCKIAAAALIVSALAPASFANPAGATEKSFRIGYADLDMSKPKSGATLLRRIEKGARKACDSDVPNSPRFASAEIRCRNKAISSAVKRLGFPTLTMAWAGKYPKATLAAR
jgi:UrcA family protein